MDELKKIRLQVIDPTTGEVIENVDAKTATGAVYLSDGTTLQTWMDNREVGEMQIAQNLAIHTTSKHVDEDKVDSLFTDAQFDPTTGEITFTNHGGQTVVVTTELEDAVKGVAFVDGADIAETAGQPYLAITTAKGETNYVDLSDLLYDTEQDATEVQLTIDDDKVISASLVDGGISRAKIDADFEKAIADLEANVGTGTSVDDRITSAIEALDAEIATAEESVVNVAITEVDGKLTAVTATIDDETFDAYGAAEAVQGETTETVASVDAKVEALTEASKVTVEKLAAATEGYISSYVVKQNGVQVGATIDIPKDYLVKSAELKTAGADVDGVAEGHKYIDFVVNSVEGEGNESHILLDVNTLVDVYGVAEDAEQVQLALDPTTNKFSATIVDGGISYEKLDQDLKDKVDAEYELPAATKDTLGGVTVDPMYGVSIDPDTNALVSTTVTFSIEDDNYPTDHNVATQINMEFGSKENVISYIPNRDLDFISMLVTRPADIPALMANFENSEGAEMEYQWYYKVPYGRVTNLMEGCTSNILDLATYFEQTKKSRSSGCGFVIKSGVGMMFYCVASAPNAEPVASPWFSVSLMLGAGDI